MMVHLPKLWNGLIFFSLLKSMPGMVGFSLKNA